MGKFRILAAASLIGAAAPAQPVMQARSHDAPVPSTAGAAALSVMTYNVKGLPWPVAFGRDADLQSIGQRLAQLRARGRQPHIIALQEAFTGQAKAIGRLGGYAYVVQGPGADQVGPGPASASDRAFAADASWTKGETEGKFVDSGLEILSDYPIVRVRRAAFPSFACAGYDCLSNKGVLMVSIQVPGSRVPVDVLDTHLNSRGASGTPDVRNLYAYSRQVDFLGSFIAANHDRAAPLIMAGDYNMGPGAPRRSVLLNHVHGWSNGVGGALERDGLSTCMADLSSGISRLADARWIMQRGRDWQFMSNGAHVALQAADATVPFGRDAKGAMLSDHMGFSIGYRLLRS